MEPEYVVFVTTLVVVAGILVLFGAMGQISETLLQSALLVLAATGLLALAAVVRNRNTT